MIKGLLQGNFQLAASLVLSGNNFQKIALLAKFLNLGLPSESTFHRWQRIFINPVIIDYWQNMQSDRLDQLKGTEIIITGTKQGIFICRAATIGQNAFTK